MHSTMDIKGILKTVNRTIHTRAFIDYSLSFENTIFIAGTGRSGTTWISSIINYKNDYRYIFEPFHPNKVSICRNFRYRQYLRPENLGREFIGPARAIITGKIRNHWTDYYNARFISSKRIIKDIRANHLLYWIHTNFTDVAIVLLLRHPCAVTSSKLLLNWNTHLDEFLVQDDLMEDFLCPFRTEIKEAGTMFEKHIFQWCIENYVPLKQFKRGQIHLAFYENFCTEPVYETRRLFSFLGIKSDDEVFTKLGNPSLQSRKQSAIVSGESLVDNWRKYVTDDQIERAVQILELFSLESIYSHESLPNIVNAYRAISEN